MISVRVGVSRGRLRSLYSSGHAIDPGEGSPACAAVSVLVAGTSRTLSGRGGCHVDGRAPEPGSLELKVLRVRPGRGRWLRGVTDLLLQGLRDVADEYPEALQLTIEEKGE
ncbi:MAG: ribosomal-processing cysteine protease Prp [Alkalispirochaetaceae bacterium]